MLTFSIYSHVCPNLIVYMLSSTTSYPGDLWVYLMEYFHTFVLSYFVSSYLTKDVCVCWQVLDSKPLHNGLSADNTKSSHFWCFKGTLSCLADGFFCYFFLYQQCIYNFNVKRIHTKLLKSSCLVFVTSKLGLNILYCVLYRFSYV